MSSSIPRPVAAGPRAVLGVVAIVCLAAGCAGSGIEESSFLGMPDGVVWKDVEQNKVQVVWGPDPDSIYLVTAGSGNCPVLAAEESWASPHELTLSIRAFTGITCSGDMSARTSLIRLDPDHYAGPPLEVTVESREYEWEREFTLEGP